jgi:hypothetical protein
MNRYVINGHGWSGSLAQIDYLNCHLSAEYAVIPGEFDHFRTPGALRGALLGSSPMSSHHSGGLKRIVMLSCEDVFPMFCGLLR